jgi:hypothetical protein
LGNEARQTGERQMTHEEAITAYNANIDLPHGDTFYNVTGRFQENFLREGVTSDCDEAFRRAVECAVKLLPAMKAGRGQ